VRLVEKGKGKGKESDLDGKLVESAEFSFANET